MAVIAGRTRLSLGDINWVAFGVELVLYGAFYWLHGYIAGVQLS